MTLQNPHLLHYQNRLSMNKNQRKEDKEKVWTHLTYKENTRQCDKQYYES